MSTAYFTDERFDAHTAAGHPEHAGRLQAIRQRMASSGLVERLIPVDAQPALEDVLALVHRPRYLAQLQSTRRLGSINMLEPDTYVSPQSYDLARLAVGGVLRVVGAVVTGEAERGLAAVRPPGHHATPWAAMGFCLLNNVAVAARYAQREYGLERVAIVDYDVHHGNGTQDSFYADPTVLYVSTHQWPLYPGTGAVAQVGEGPGAGDTINIPLPPGSGDDGYVRAFDEVVLPAVRRFSPQLLLVSVGFDAHWRDPLAQMSLSLRGYDELARKLIHLAGTTCAGRVVFVLEGGYDLEALSIGWANVARALLGDETIEDPLGAAGRPQPSVDGLIERLRHVHKLD